MLNFSIVRPNRIAVPVIRVSEAKVIGAYILIDIDEYNSQVGPNAHHTIGTPTRDRSPHDAKKEFAFRQYDDIGAVADDHTAETNLSQSGVPSRSSLNRVLLAMLTPSLKIS